MVAAVAGGLAGTVLGIAGIPMRAGRRSCTGGCPDTRTSCVNWPTCTTWPRRWTVDAGGRTTHPRGCGGSRERWRTAYGRPNWTAPATARPTSLGEVSIRDAGLLESAAARPRSKAFGEDVYPSIYDKAAALLHSLDRNHALVDGNKRLALAATIAFYGLNGLRLTMSNDEAYDLVMAIAAGDLNGVEPIAYRLASGTQAWS